MSNYKEKMIKEILISLKDKDNFVEILKKEIIFAIKNWFEIFKDVKDIHKELILEDMEFLKKSFQSDLNTYNDVLFINIVLNNFEDTNKEIIQKIFTYYVFIKSIEYIYEKYYNIHYEYKTDFEKIWDELIEYNQN